MLKITHSVKQNQTLFYAESEWLVARVQMFFSFSVSASYSVDFRSHFIDWISKACLLGPCNKKRIRARMQNFCFMASHLKQFLRKSFSGHSSKMRLLKLSKGKSRNLYQEPSQFFWHSPPHFPASQSFSICPSHFLLLEERAFLSSA